VGEGNAEWREVVGRRYAGSVMRSCGSLGALLVPLGCALACREPAHELTLAQQASTLLAAGAPAQPPPCASESLHQRAPELALVPRALGGYCIDANAEVRVAEKRALGAAVPRETTAELADACSRRLGPLCEGYLAAGLERLVLFRYAGGRGGTGALDVVFARFASSEGSFGAFGDQVLGDRDPSSSRIDALEADGTAVRLGAGDEAPSDAAPIGGSALAWRGRYLVRLGYTNSSETAAELEESADALFRGVFAHVARALSQQGADAAALPRAVQLLPASGRVPFGVRYQSGDVLGVAGVRGAAEGYYREGGKRWRLLLMVQPDPETADDVRRAFERHPDGHELRWAPQRGLRFHERRPAGEPSLDWVIGQKGAIVLGIGDDPGALPAGISAAEEMEVKLTVWQKLEKLVDVARSVDPELGALAAPAVSPEGSSAARGGTP
jgi:hypothetical protein